MMLFWTSAELLLVSLHPVTCRPVMAVLLLSVRPFPSWPPAGQVDRPQGLRQC